MRLKIFILSFFFLKSLLFGELNFVQKAMVMSTLWQTTSAEYYALSQQAYSLARLRLDEELKQYQTQRRAVVVDVDETVLDNTPFEIKIILEDAKYPDDFDEWVNSAQCEKIPGALNFLNYASQNGCEIFYVSNRRLRHLDGTLKNLLKWNFPNADAEHILLKDSNSNKEIRFNKIAQDYHIVMLIGDNLADFSNVFRKKNIAERFAFADSLKDEFGKRFIVLPNPIYGEWEKTVYGGSRSIPLGEKEEKMMKILKGEM